MANFERELIVVDIKQESTENRLRRVSEMLADINGDDPEAFERLRQIAMELVGLLELDFKIMAAARKILTV